ncbi:MAG: hypothetical protein IPM24_15960 [Bryobacterales bacterium]|nr:hypothetical protein [Bryobacterales bacterium]
MRRIGALIVGASLLAACSGKTRPPEPLFETRVTERRAGPCGADGQVDCAGARIEYPACVAAPVDEICERINRTVAEWVLRPLDGGAPFDAPDAVIERFLEDHGAERQRAPDGRHTWSMERTVRVSFQGPQAISLSALESGFTGGPHPFSSLTYLTFRPATGERLTLSEILVENGRHGLDAAGEIYFRQARELAAGAVLADEGFRFPGGRFTLPENFAFNRVGLQFHFNVDDIAPYPLGETGLTIPQGEALPWLRPEFQ